MRPLLFVSDLDRAFPIVLNLLEEFGQISGYKQNVHKSELMPINAAAMAYPLSDLSFKTSIDLLIGRDIYWHFATMDSD